MKKHLHIYTRVSTQRQSEFGYSLDAQKKLGAKKAKELNAEPVYFIERGVSASTDLITNMPMLKKLLDLCDDGQVTDVFVTEWDRLTRNAYSQLYIKRVFRSNNIKLHTPTQIIDLSDDEQEFFTDLYALFAQREKRSKKEK
jgi:DNA invertase Pin-like site-specific DNA recombinase